eukprot:636107-Alexandrium_andersonii.AAC.1
MRESRCPPPIPHVQTQLALRITRRLLRLAVRVGVRRFSPILCRGDGCLAHWACWDRGPVGLDVGPRAHSNQRVQ